MYTPHVPDSRSLRRAVIGLATLAMVLASDALCAQATPGAKLPQPGAGARARAAPRTLSVPPATPDVPAGDRACGPDLGGGRGLAVADTDGDGKISREEFMQLHEARFERLPKDRNGLVSVEDAMRHAELMPDGMAPRGMAPGALAPDRMAAPGSGPRRPGTLPPQPPASPMSPASPEPGSRPSGTNSPDGVPNRGPPAPTGDAASSSASSPSSTPSSSSPQEAKPGT